MLPRTDTQKAILENNSKKWKKDQELKEVQAQIVSPKAPKKVAD